MNHVRLYCAAGSRTMHSSIVDRTMCLAMRSWANAEQAQRQDRWRAAATRPGKLLANHHIVKLAQRALRNALAWPIAKST